MAIPVIVATPGAVNANSFGTRAEADIYHDTQLHPDAPWPSSVSATAVLGSGTNGTVTISVDAVGTEGNAYTVSAAAAVGANAALSGTLVGTVLTLTLGTTAVAGVLDPAKNTAILVSAIIHALTGISASYSGTGAASIPVTASKLFTGGSYFEEIKNPALIMAAQQMTALIMWTGYTTSSTQSLPWPRVGMVQRNYWASISDNTIPIELKIAQFELARLLYYSDRTAESDVEAQGISSLKAGPVSLVFKESESSSGIIPDNILNLLVPSWIDSIVDQNSGTRELMRA